MANEIINQAIGVAGGAAVGSSLTIWFIKRYIVKLDEMIKAFYTLAASFEAWKRMPEENRIEIKGHEKRITIIEPAVARAHERLDDMKRSIQ